MRAAGAIVTARANLGSKGKRASGKLLNAQIPAKIRWNADNYNTFLLGDAYLGIGRYRFKIEHRTGLAMLGLGLLTASFTQSSMSSSSVSRFSWLPRSFSSR
jgi:hypothetical protein